MRSSAKKTASRQTTASAQSSGRPEAARSPTRNRARPGGTHAGAQSRAACLRPATNRRLRVRHRWHARATGRASPTTGEVDHCLPGPTRSAPIRSAPGSTKSSGPTAAPLPGSPRRTPLPPAARSARCARQRRAPRRRPPARPEAAACRAAPREGQSVPSAPKPARLGRRPPPSIQT